MESVLFVCRANVGRSQMAEAFFNHAAPEGYLVQSAGTHVSDADVGQRIGDLPKARYVVDVMSEKGIDISSCQRTLLCETLVRHADLVFYMGIPEDMPKYLSSSLKLFLWDVEDAKGRDYAFHVQTRDKIFDKVGKLVQNLLEEE